MLLALLVSAQPGLTLFFRDTNATGFNGGTFQNTIYNPTIGAVALNWSDATNKTYALSGNFTSRLFDAGSIVEWSNISWSPAAPYGMPLPSGQRDEPAAGVDGGANMSGNILLLNFDEPDGSTTFEDLSGTGNNASCAFTSMCPMRNDSGMLNGSLSFNVTNSTVIVNQSSALDVSQVTIEAWVKLRNVMFTNVSAFYNHACALTNTGEVYCWGRNNYGQLGDGTTQNRPYAVKVLGLENVTMLAAGFYHTCGIVANGTAYCWGWNGYGQLGDGTTANRYTAVVAGWGLNFTYISAGAYSTCGIVANGTAYCWGYNNYGQLGDGTTTDRSRPSNVTDSGDLNFSKVSISYVHACGISTNGTVYCWGRGARGALGTNATSSTNTTPVEILIKLNATEVKAGGAADEEFSCALVTNGTIYCWGYGGSGRLGTGDSTSRNLSTAVAGSFNATAISLSY
ncbi:MAG TPA: hypothetical protein VM238_13115, partial [Phycisphaerae bacterium]|nr:hypothetical protein [Phycisphaerae bacterium]